MGELPSQILAGDTEDEEFALEIGFEIERCSLPRRDYGPCIDVGFPTWFQPDGEAS